MNKTVDIDIHKRTLWFQEISPATTQKSLERFLSEYRIEKCTVPLDNYGHNKHYGFVLFAKESSTIDLMSRGKLIIDDQVVFIHRCVPDIKSSKYNRDIKTLIVTSTESQSLQKSDLEKYFSRYGDIDFINDNGNAAVIHFKHYDFVDLALLDRPHIINRVPVSIEKGDRDLSTSGLNSNENYPTTNNFTTATNNLNMKFATDLHISPPYPQEVKYCIHIKNLPMSIDAETLSIALNWSINDIVMKQSIDGQSSSTECWLKGLDDQEKINKFILNSKQRTIHESIIRWEKEEDKMDLCEYFRTGRCERFDDECHWLHVKCTKNDTCSTDCPYGHAKGIKSEHSTLNNVRTTYYIIISGFETKLTRKGLAQLLQEPEKYFYIDEKENHVDYISIAISFKIAKTFMKKWHDQCIGGHKLKCQLEIDRKSSTHRTLSTSRQSYNDNESDNDSRYHWSYRSSNNCSRQSSRCSSISRDSGQVFNDKETLQKDDTKRTIIGSTGFDEPSSNAKQSVSRSVSSDEWEIIQQVSGSGKKASLIRRKSDRKLTAVKKLYKNESTGDCYRELTALKMLKGVPGVVQLIEPEDESNNFERDAGGEVDLWIILQRAPTNSLKKFMDQKRGKYGHDIEVSSAIKFVQNLIGIVKQVHSRGILHQNIEPENIVIKYELKNQPIDKVNLTLLNFTQAYIKSNELTHINHDEGNHWYQSPQAYIQSFKNSAINDASAIVAILLWLLTDEIPQHHGNILPHHLLEIHSRIDRKISNAVDFTNRNQLKTYVIDTFNRAFGFPNYEPWTIEELDCRIESILELLISSDSKRNTIENIFQDLLHLATLPKLMSTASDHPPAIQKAADAFAQAKQEFYKSNQDRYVWYDGYCTWLHNKQNSVDEYRHDDILTYYWRNQNYSIITICFASINDEGRVITLSIGSTVQGKMIRIPLGQYSIAQDYVKELQETFTMELRNLLLSIYNKQKSGATVKTRS
ncbi:unnamed protein product [Rotaria socialis]|uniref:Uncharacterized protein n=2 Tax=Rotaria socialis TaxID=392032 RepID=A0A821IP19_9BILA|nr:unnamed protein product [Rotaria socialis]